MYNPRKVVIFGAGAVGLTFAYALAQKTLADEISIIDVTREYGEGQVLEIEADLSVDEQKLLDKSAKTLKNAFDELHDEKKYCNSNNYFLEL